ncbi:type II toxin-antitoxin system VapC family toxin [Piscinibacter sakaiensis]|uniref:type II toxin-antitoxin system VapC family toxin n=1 Tax=Piscinibacter sakaiensis TaxID=1547922 RepID=UPI003AADE27F
MSEQVGQLRLLLDTHALIWWWTDDPRLSAAVRSALMDEANEIFVSAASAWEIATKQRLGKLPGVPEAATRLVELLNADGFTPLAIDQRHALRAGSWPIEHRDPFDRMLAAQSELQGLTLVSCDAALSAFGCRMLW